MSADGDASGDSPDGSGGAAAHVDVDPGVRDHGTQILEADPDLSLAAFAGQLFRDRNVAPDTAADLYDSLIATDAVGDGDDGDQDATDAGADDVDDATDQSDPVADPEPTAGDDRGQDAIDDVEAPPAPPTPPEPPVGAERGENDQQTIADRIADHYARADAVGVYDALGAIDANATDADRDLSCIGVPDFTGWYRTKDDATGRWDGRGRPFALGREFETIRDQLGRDMYATVNYAPAPWFLEAWDRYRWTGSGDDRAREWDGGGSPTPEYADVAAYAPFADVDLADDMKHARPAGDAPTDRIDDALRRYIDAFAELAGGREHVFALDSVGGAYLFIAPTSTAPIAAAFDRDDRAAIFEALTDRMNSWLTDVGERVTDATGLGGVFEPDAINNKNRLYKAPLSVHKSVDGVVTPIDTADPSYRFTALEVADAELVGDARDWSDRFTGDHTEAVGAIVAGLWPEYDAGADGWRDALAAWLEDHRADQERNAESENDRIPSNEIPDDLETTDNLEVINSKIEGIDVGELIDDTIGAAVTGESTENSNNGVRFDPPWRGSNSGQSCFADSAKFYDPDSSYSGGGALEFIAAERKIVNRPGDKLTGNKYWQAVNALREEGYNIPYYEGKGDRKHPDVLRLFEETETEEEKKRQLARALFADR